MHRDARGRFVKGNKVAEGNKGNRYPRYGNKNAVKHGMHSRQLFSQKIIGDDLILIALHKGIAVRFFKGEWINHGDGFTILGDKALYAQELLGWNLTPVKILNDSPSEISYEQFIESIIIKEPGYFNSILGAIDKLYA